jgi:tRNA threonylcarbamoyladenosine biosynthesis protein TsaB
MNIISIDTSTKVCSVALHQNGGLLACYELFAEKSHSSMLTTLVQNVVTQSGMSFSQIDAFAVAKGPGSYTGLRIGVSSAKGLCYALDRPLVAVNTLEAMAYQVKDFVDGQHLICPMIDARRMEVYCAIYQPKEDTLIEIEPTQAKIINEESFSERLSQKSIVFLGDGAAKCKTILGLNTHSVFPNTPIHPSAKTIGILANQYAQAGKFEDVITFEPYYLKEFMATTPK